MFEAGCEAEEAGDFARAREVFRRGGERGDSNCWVRLGMMIEEGLGGPADREAAMASYRRAWRRKNSLAANNIAVLYGEVGRRRARVQWMKRAAQAGLGVANLPVARAYLQGDGVRRSPAQAKVHVLEAARYLGLDDEERSEVEALGAKIDEALREAEGR